MVRELVHKYDDEFIAKYASQEPPWGPLGWVTYKRTYARWLPSEKRTETWIETCRRVLEGNYNLTPDDPTITKEEMERAFHYMFNMLWLPPGRGLWMSGTEHAAKNGSSLNNCWFIAVRPDVYREGGRVRPSLPFGFAMDMLMLGGGVGFSVTEDNVRQFPRVKNSVDIVVVCDPKHPNIKELDAEAIPPRDRSHTYYRVPDTREGWGRALAIMIDAHWKGYEEYTLVLDVSDVRPSGKRIKGFGGTASGPGPLVDMLRSINRIINAKVSGRLDEADLTDMMNYVGKCVVAGNVRRSSEIALGPATDKFINLKYNDPVALKDRRWASNNSVVIDDAFDNFEPIAKALRANGEPGVFNLERSRNFGRLVDGEQPGIDGLVEGTNPCGEVSLESGESCNLVELFPAKVLEAGVDLADVAIIAYRYAKRVTCAPHSWEISRKVVEKNRRIGVSISGWSDFKTLLNAQGRADERTKILDSIYRVICIEDKSYSALLGINESIKKTTVKPSGSVSLLNGSSPGRHRHYFEHGIRRIRMQAKDPLVEVLIDGGFHVEPDAYSPNTSVVEFPVKSPGSDLPGFKTADEDTLEEQCQDQMELQTYWADNSVSSTLTFTEDEVDQISDMLRKYKFKSTSMLPYTGHGFEQAPYEPITEEEYEQRMAQIRFWPTEAHMSKEKRDMELIAQDECASGACPIK